jgi:cytochrome c-type biogenesis protein
VEAEATAFWIGLLAATSPCVLPLYPGYLAYLSAQPRTTPGQVRRLLGPAVLAGVLTMMLAIGALVTTLSMAVGRALTLLVPISLSVILVMGLAMLAGRNPFQRLPGIRIRGTRRPVLDAYTYGLLFGPIALPCCGPLVVAIFALSATVGEALQSLWVFLWFGIGMGAPLLALSFVPSSFQRRVTAATARHGRAIEIIGGLLLIGVALYYISENWDLFLLYLG